MSLERPLELDSVGVIHARTLGKSHLLSHRGSRHVLIGRRPHQVQELVAGAGIAFEVSEHARCHCGAVGLLNTPHSHAQVHTLNHDSDTMRVERFLQRGCNLLGQALLHLKPPRKELRHTHELGQTDHLAPREVGDVCSPVERDKMMLAHAEELDVAKHDHLVRVLCEYRLVEHRVQILLVPLGEEAHCLDIPGGCLDEALARGVLPQFLEQCCYRSLCLGIALFWGL
mmetsp:Transcript_1386/g.3030  ORF Transcript_1386/g.3030 Transcript_1386/m.3030 type:complete len:228 (-) Transcript_1386:134-817(-)